MLYFKDSMSLSVPWWMCVQTPIDTTGIFKHAETLILEAKVQLNACQKTIRNRQIKWLCNQYCRGKQA